MNNMNRRDLCVALSSLAALAAAVPAGGQASSDEPVLSVPRSFRFDELPVKTGPNSPIQIGVPVLRMKSVRRTNVSST